MGPAIRVRRIVWATTASLGTGGCCGRSRFEGCGHWYRLRLRNHRWKDRCPRRVDLFRGGVSKRQLPSHDVARLQLFVRETGRAELTHWWSTGPGPLLRRMEPAARGRVLIAYGVVANLPLILVQRYSRFRTQGLIERR